MSNSRKYRQNERVEQLMKDLAQAVSNQAGMEVLGVISIALGKDSENKPVPIVVTNLTQRDDRPITYIILSKFLRQHAEELKNDTDHRS